MTLPFAKQDVFKVLSEEDFTATALLLFRFQYDHNAIYHNYCRQIGIAPEAVMTVDDIPCLPISFFKTHKVYLSGLDAPQMVFSSSGTTGQQRSRHNIYDLSLYKMSFEKGFVDCYGDASSTILALLPSYSRGQSSLIYMVDGLIASSGYAESKYYTSDFKALRKVILSLKERQIPTVLIGVSHALLDFVKTCSLNVKQLIVMETGGMKGRRAELIREELHNILCDGFGVSSIHSEYGLTELLSQAYAKNEGIFKCPPWMKVLPRELSDPLSKGKYGHTSGINIIDLANVYSCAFIATEDLGIVYEDGNFEVLGRFQNTDIRGCNLLYTSQYI